MKSVNSKLWYRASLTVAFVLVVSAAGVLFATGALGGSRASVGTAGTGTPIIDLTDSLPDTPPCVHTITPKTDPSFTLSVKAPCQVEPYEFADLEAQVAGRVVYIREAEGSPVKFGDVLARIAIPDLDEEVQQKEA